MQGTLTVIYSFGNFLLLGDIQMRLQITCNFALKYLGNNSIYKKYPNPEQGKDLKDRSCEIEYFALAF